MRKYIPQLIWKWVGITALLCAGIACDSSDGGQQQVPDTDTPGLLLSGTFSDCPMDSIRLYVQAGFESKVIKRAALVQVGDMRKFQMSGEVKTGFYLLGQAPNNLKTVLLGTEKNVQISGNCRDLRRFGAIENAVLNSQYQTAKDRLQKVSREGLRIAAEWMNATSSSSSLTEEARQIFQQEQQILDSVRQQQPFLAKALYPHLWFPFEPDNPLPRHMQQWEQFVSTLDLSDPDWEQIPALAEQIARYAPQLLSPKHDPEKGKEYLEVLLDKIPDNSPVKRNVYANVLSALDDAALPVYANYALQYKSMYPLSNRVNTYLDDRIAAYEKDLETEKTLGLGATPPNIALPTPEGTALQLRDLRGKIVLLDFWASWCGPCRKENPLLVRLYDRYADKGLEILSVSLDRSREAWVQAIADDQMRWKHVSDLKHYRSQAAQDYRLSFIPMNYLLDRNGKILAKNIRGNELERKLAALFP